MTEQLPRSPREVGSRWVDPETGVRYVFTNRKTYINYLLPVGPGSSSSRPVLVSEYRSDDVIIARLTPLEPRTPDDIQRSVRVLRMIEYKYADMNSYLEDKVNWTIEHKNPRCHMQSSVVSIQIEGGSEDDTR